MEKRPQQPQELQNEREELLYFWALGDLHYYDRSEWRVHHTPRLRTLYQDVRRLWEQEGAPAFCVSPGDIIEMAEPEHYQLAAQQLRANLARVPFFPGLGNHELMTLGGESVPDLLTNFSTFWSHEPRYYWTCGEVLCIMLDVMGYPNPLLTRETLSFLEIALRKHPQHIAVIFAHCPLYNTVQGRDPMPDLDYDSLEPFFSLENSAEVRALLARYPNACLYVSGHTHSSWQSPGLVTTENLGGHPFSSLNLSSPWYTGKHKGAKLQEAGQSFLYHADRPDFIASFAVHISRDNILLRLRDHVAGNWLQEWSVPVGKYPAKD